MNIMLLSPQASKEGTIRLSFIAHRHQKTSNI